jgi:hypothetical protein
LRARLGGKHAAAAAAAGAGNRSAAEALRARLGGKAPPAAAAAGDGGGGGTEVVHLPLVDAAGRAAPGAFGRETAADTQRALEAAAGGRVAKRVQRYGADGTRERYFADDDSTDLQVGMGMAVIVGVIQCDSVLNRLAVPGMSRGSAAGGACSVCAFLSAGHSLCDSGSECCMCVHDSHTPPQSQQRHPRYTFDPGKHASYGSQSPGLGKAIYFQEPASFESRKGCSLLVGLVLYHLHEWPL